MEALSNKAPVFQFLGSSTIDTEPVGYSWANSVSSAWARNIIQTQDGGFILSGLGRGSSNLYETRVVSLNASGQLNTGFADQGVLHLSYTGSAIDEVQGAYQDSNGQVLVLGRFYVAGDPNVAVGPDSPSNGYALSLSSLNLGGSFDTGFGVDGRVVLGLAELGSGYLLPSSLCFQSDGKMLVAYTAGTIDGSSVKNEHAALLRLNADGSLDDSFHGTGYVDLPASYGAPLSLAVGANDEILLTVALRGGEISLGPLQWTLTDLNLDASGSVVGAPEVREINGRKNDNWVAIRAFDVDAAGRALIVMDTGNIWFARRMLADGTVDSSFNAGVDLVLPMPEGVSDILADKVVSVPDGGYLIEGDIRRPLSEGSSSTVSSSFLVKVTASGDLDTGFGTQGFVETSTGQRLDQVLALAGGSVVWAGSADLERLRMNETNLQSSFAVSKLTASGQLDAGFGGELGLTERVMVWENSSEYQQLSAVTAAQDPDLQGQAGSHYGGYRLAISRQSGANPADGFAGISGLVLTEGGQALLDGLAVAEVESLTGTLSLVFNDSVNQAVLGRVLSHIGYKYLVQLPPVGAPIVKETNPGLPSGELVDYYLINLLWQLQEPATQGSAEAAPVGQAVTGLLLYKVDHPTTGTIEITGLAQVGSSLKLVSHLVDPDGELIIRNISWRADGEWILGQGNGTDTLVLSANELGKLITVDLQSFDSGYGFGNFSQSLTEAVQAAPGKRLDLLAYQWKTHALLGHVDFTAGTHSGSTDLQGAASLAAVTDSNLSVSASRPVPADEAQATTNAVNLQDAIAILKMIVGLDVNAGGEPLSPYQALAADFDGNSRVELNDAIGVLKHVVGLPSPEPQWLFFNEADPSVPGRANLSPGAVPVLSASLAGTGAIHLGLVGVLRGDVDGSYGGAAGALDLDVTQPDYLAHLVASTGLAASQFGVYLP
jgi:uncharacterized delta-60 repeat protein